eukprot:66388-Chlamydomonas_euryale.AAC.1
MRSTHMHTKERQQRYLHCGDSQAWATRLGYGGSEGKGRRGKGRQFLKAYRRKGSWRQRA